MLFLYKMTKLFGKNKINSPILNICLVNCWNLVGLTYICSFKKIPILNFSLHYGIIERNKGLKC